MELNMSVYVGGIYLDVLVSCTPNYKGNAYIPLEYSDASVEEICIAGNDVTDVLTEMFKDMITNEVNCNLPEVLAEEAACAAEDNALRRKEGRYYDDDSN